MAINNYYLGTELPYFYRPQSICKPPKGYVPVYISHLGRHGSRYLASDHPVIYLKQILDEAMKMHTLRSKGYKLRKQVEVFEHYVAQKYGLLTPKGVVEEQDIAKRMYERFRPVFTKGKTLYAESTYVTRTKESMDAFVSVLKSKAPDLKEELKSNGKVDPILRFFDLNTAYLDYKAHGPWIDDVKRYEMRNCTPIIFLKQFFDETYIMQLERPIAVATYIYDLYANTFNIGIHLGFRDYFNEEVLRYFWENENLQNYLLKGPSYECQNLPAQIAFALLRDFIREADEALKNGNIAANLRFAHAETLLPFVTLLDLPGSNKQTNDFECVSQIWKDYWLAPMGANIQFIFYKNEYSDCTLVQLLYNECNYALPFEPVVGYFYNWDEMRRDYLCLLEQLPIPQEESIVLQVQDFKPCEASCNGRHRKKHYLQSDQEEIKTCRVKSKSLEQNSVKAECKEMCQKTFKTVDQEHHKREEAQPKHQKKAVCSKRSRRKKR